MIYEIYSRQGLAIAIEHSGSLRDILNLIAQSELLIGKNSYGKAEALFVRKGQDVLHVCEAEEDWSHYIRIITKEPNPEVAPPKFEEWRGVDDPRPPKGE